MFAERSMLGFFMQSFSKNSLRHVTSRSIQVIFLMFRHASQRT